MNHALQEDWGYTFGYPHFSYIYLIYNYIRYKEQDQLQLASFPLVNQYDKNISTTNISSVTLISVWLFLNTELSYF